MLSSGLHLPGPKVALHCIKTIGCRPAWLQDQREPVGRKLQPSLLVNRSESLRRHAAAFFCLRPVIVRSAHGSHRVVFCQNNGKRVRRVPSREQGTKPKQNGSEERS